MSDSPRTTLHKYSFVLTTAFLVLATAARAQTPALGNETDAQAKWTQASYALHQGRRKVAVVLLKDPDRRRMCRVLSVTENALVCKQRRGEATYARGDIAEIVETHSKAWPRLLLGLDVGVAGASVTGIVLLASVSTAAVVGAGIPLGVVAVAALVDMAFSLEGDCGKNVFSDAQDAVLYLR